MGTLNCDALRQFQQYATNANDDQAVQISGVGLRSDRNETRNRDDVVTLSDRNISLNDGHRLQDAKYTAGAFRRALHLGANDTRFANNAARTLFLNAVLKECGKARVEDLDEGIRKELQLGNFDARKRDGGYRATSGKPLTVRRINAVLTAVVDWKKTQTGEEDRAIDGPVNRAVGNADVMVNDETGGVESNDEADVDETENGKVGSDVNVTTVEDDVKAQGPRVPRTDAAHILSDLDEVSRSIKALKDNYRTLSAFPEQLNKLPNAFVRDSLKMSAGMEDSVMDDSDAPIKGACMDVLKSLDALEQLTKKNVKLLIDTGRTGEADRRLAQAESLVKLFDRMCRTSSDKLEENLAPNREFPPCEDPDEAPEGENTEEYGNALKNQATRLSNGAGMLAKLVETFRETDRDIIPRRISAKFMHSEAFKAFVEKNGFDGGAVDGHFQTITDHDEKWQDRCEDDFEEALKGDPLEADEIFDAPTVNSPNVADSFAFANKMIMLMLGGRHNDKVPEDKTGLRDELARLHLQFLMMNGFPPSGNHADEEFLVKTLLEIGEIKLDGGYYNDMFNREVTKNLKEFDRISPCNDENALKSQVRDLLDEINWPLKPVDCSENRILSKDLSGEGVTYAKPPPVIDDARRFAADLACSEKLEYTCLKHPEAERFQRVLIDNRPFAEKLLGEAVAYIESRLAQISSSEDRSKGGIRIGEDPAVRQRMNVFSSLINGDSDKLTLIDACASAKGLDKTTRQILQKYLQRMLDLSYEAWFDKGAAEVKEHGLLRKNNTDPQSVLKAFTFLVDTPFDGFETRHVNKLVECSVTFLTFAVGAAEEIQKEFNRSIDDLFPKDDHGAFDPDAESLDEIVSSGPDYEIELVKNALKRYFTSTETLDKSLLLATLLRQGGLALQGDKRTAAILKSTGPIMLKMLQGLDKSRLGDRMKNILSDLKYRLFDIPTYQVKAYLGDIIARSNGTISKIEIVRALGAASVGQTFLCNITGNDGKTQLCAVKVLRAGAKVRAFRERKVLEDVAKDMGEGMRATFSGKVDRIMREFDLSIEALNIDKGRKVYASSLTGLENVDSVERSEGVDPTDHVMTMKAVRKDTYEQYLEDVSTEIKATDDPIKLKELRARVVRNHRALEELAKLWIGKAIFTEGGGIYHGDLHSGNIMVDENGKATMIDFGNITELTDDETKAFLHLIAGAAAGMSFDTGGVIFAIKSLLSPESAETLQKRLDDERARKAEGKMDKTLEDRIKHIIGLGNGQDVGLRVTAVLKLLKAEGLEVPPAIHNFNESQVRLGEVLNLSKKALESIDAKLGGAPTDEEPLHSLVECVGEVVKANVDFTIGRVGTLNGMSFAAGFLHNGLITNEQYNDIAKTSASNWLGSFFKS